jgi:predicted DNA binding CopG/RHH family protein
MAKRPIESKIVKLDLQVKALRKENRFLKQRIKELGKSRDLQKGKFKYLQTQKAVFLDNKISSEVAIKRHKYNELTVRICVSLAMISGVGRRGVVAILLCIEAELGFLKEIPSKSSIDNWLKKVGFYRYCNYESYQYKEDYCLIVDDSMMVGSQRLLLILSMKAAKIEQGAIKFSDIHIESIVVKKTWGGESIKEELQKVKEKKGKNPLYCISDSASIMG